MLRAACAGINLLEVCLSIHKGCFMSDSSFVETFVFIRESVDSLCRDGADAQYMQYLSKSRITSRQTR